MKFLAFVFPLLLTTSAAIAYGGPVRQGAKLVASDGAPLDQFGNSVAISDDTLVIGAYQQGSLLPGAAYVFVKPAGGWSGTLTESAKLTGSDAGAFTNFGAAVGISGDTIVVGAPWSNNSHGAAYVFIKPTSGWSGRLTETAKLIASDGRTPDLLGLSVAISDDIIIAAAPQANVTVPDQGAGYVFVKPAGGWNGILTETAKLTASDAAGGDTMGFSFDGHGVAVSGDTIVCGAYHFTGAQLPGRAYVFVRPAGGWSGNLTQTAELKASDGIPFDGFSNSVSLDLDTIVIGDAGATIGSNTRQGAAYVFVRPEGGWSETLTETAKLTASDGQAFDNFGWSVAIHSIRHENRRPLSHDAGHDDEADDDGERNEANKDEVIIGAPLATIGSNAQQGAFYRFLRTARNWNTTSRFKDKLIASDGMPRDEFGWSVAIGTVIVSGATLNPNRGPGAAYVFTSGHNK